MKHTSILASAGSGKTYQLTQRYLGLLAGSAEPSTILATTFTRAAAGEIRDRVLGDLADAALNEENARDLAKRLGRRGFDRAAAADLLGRTVGRLHRLQIRTLDSFFSAVVRCFALELDLPLDAEIVDADGEILLRRGAIRDMLDERDPQPLINLLRELIEGRSDRGVTDHLDREVSALYALFCEAPPEAWCTIERWPTLAVPDVVDAIEGLRLAGESAAWTHKSMAKAWADDVARARSARPGLADDWCEFICKGLTNAILTKDATYYNKTIPADVIAAYAPLIRHARGVLRNSIASRTEATFELLERYDRCYRARRMREKALTFADLTAATARLERDTRRASDLSDLYFRLDARIAHLLLDEFQDTSIGQWRAIEPIVEEILSHRVGEDDGLSVASEESANHASLAVHHSSPAPVRSFFCVGDVKQSIYGWRDACPELLEGLAQRYAAITPDHLEKSYRSSPVIIDAVNATFTDLSSNPALDDYAEAAAAWDATWRRHETAMTDLPGFFEIRTCRRAEEDEQQGVVRLQTAADLVADLYRRTGGRKSIGVLLRTNKAVHRVLYELGPSRREIPATGRGGGALTDAPAVNAVLDLLRLADHPANTIAAFNVMHSPLGEAIGMAPAWEANAIEASTRDAARTIRRDVQRDGFARTIDRWVRAIAPACDAREVRRLFELVDLALMHDRRRSVRCDDFVRFVEATAVSESDSAPVEVMTVHQSKGLQFDIVILPELEWPLVRMQNSTVVVERDLSGTVGSHAGDVTRICRAVKQEIWRQFDDLAPMFEGHMTRLARESLCNLYVATTRAKQGMFILLDPSAENERTLPKCASSVLRCVFSDGGIDPIEPEQVLVREGDDSWIDRAKTEAPPRQERAGRDTPAEAPIRLAAGAARRGRTAKPPSSCERTLADSLAIDTARSDAIDRGLVMHALFQQIEWLDAFDASDDDLRDLCRTLLPRRPVEWIDDCIASFRRALGRDAIRTILSPNGAAQVRLWRERPFIRRTSAGVQRGAIDRLVAFFDRGGRCTEVIVIDFKSDALRAQETEAAAARYRMQLDAYREAAASFLHVEPSRVAARIVFTEPGVVVELGREGATVESAVPAS